MSLQVNDYVLLLFLAIAAYYDLSHRKIPNFLTLPVMGWGLISNIFIGRLDGLLFSIYGLLLGIAFFLLPFALGWLGGGDVKMLGAVGALQGASFVFHAALFTALCGGLIALIYLVVSGMLVPVLKKIFYGASHLLFTLLALRFRQLKYTRAPAFLIKQTSIGKKLRSPSIPYGVSIAIGAAFALTGLVSFF